jgi:hypothetical protein
LAEFLEDVPPSQRRKVTRLTNGHWYASKGEAGRYALLAVPELQLHCSKCNGPRFFRSNEKQPPKIGANETNLLYVSYRCDNCKRTGKIFALHVVPDPEVAEK